MSTLCFSVCLSLPLTHTEGCTWKSSIVFVKNGTATACERERKRERRMYSLTHTISILCYVRLCVLECVCVSCGRACVCVSEPVIYQPSPSLHGRRAMSDKAKGKAKACRCIFNQNNFKLCLENNSNKRDSTQALPHKHTHLQSCDKKFVISQSNKITVLKASTHIVDAFIKTFYTARKNIF